MPNLLLRMSAALLALAVAAAACGYGTDGGDLQPPIAPPTTRDEPPPVPAGALLPDPGASSRFVRWFENPKLAEALSFVADYVPNYDRAFDVLAVVDNLSAALECLYERDHLAVAGYRHPEHTFSVGLVVVASDGVAGDLLGTAGCTLRNILHLPAAAPVPGPELRPCFDVLRVRAPGGSLTVVRLASTDWMCDDLIAGVRDRVQAVDGTAGGLESRLVDPG